MAWITVLCCLAVSAGPAYAQSPAPPSNPGLLVESRNSGTQIQWDSVDSSQVAAAAALRDLPRQQFGGYELPVALVPLRLESAPLPQAAAQISVLESAPWEGVLQPAALQEPPVLGGDPLAALAPSEPFPSQPLFVLRAGTARGVRIAVMAFSPIYRDAATGELRQVVRLDARVPGRSPLTVDVAGLLDPSDEGQMAPAAAVAEQFPPTNLAALKRSVKIEVTRAGIRRLTGAMLASAGMASSNAAKLHLWRNGARLPLHVIDANGKVDGANDEVRFYAVRPGDRWNAADIYWLTVEAGDGPRMAQQSAAHTGAPVRTSAMERGLWQDYRVYDSNYPGPDGDHWYHADLKTAPSMQGNPASWPSASFQVGNLLPLSADAGDPSVFTIHLVSYIEAPSGGLNQIDVRVGATKLTQTWNSGAGSAFQPNWSHVLTTPARSGQTQVTLAARNFNSGIKLDKVEWQQLVDLRFGADGGAFSTVDGTWGYRLQFGLNQLYLPFLSVAQASGRLSQPGSVPDSTPFHASGVPERHLYDVTDPQNPVFLGIAPEVVQFAGRHDLILTGNRTLHTPRVAAHQPVSFASVTAATALYIAPADLHGTLAPLVGLRTQQGYQVRVVDVQQIFDAWSSGDVSATAIRDFLRYVYFSGNLRLKAVTLVGDASLDPHNYLGHGNKTLVPPYLAMVDPWIGETACEPCFGQLDGDDPLSESAFLIDVPIGRLPVETAAELETVVGKIVRYESVKSSALPQRNVSTFLADDYVRPDGSKDPAGDFVSHTEEVIALQPGGVDTERIYYDYFASESGEPWRIASAFEAQERVVATLSAGSGLVTYNGHAHQWQWALIGKADESPPGLTHLFSLWDVLKLNNDDQLFVSLSMTCLTSQFTQPASQHFTLDEHLVLHRAGAVATWGPAGYGVGHGHETLQKGFHKALWAAPSLQARMGELTTAGYYEVVTTSTCCQDNAQTFLVLGDPLTRARIQPFNWIYLPMVQR